MSLVVSSGRSAMLAHTGLLSSSLSLMAQGFGMTIGAMLVFPTTSPCQADSCKCYSGQRCRRTEQHKPAKGTAAAL